MADAILADNRETVERLQSLAEVMRWLRAMPVSQRARFVAALVECSDEAHDVVASMLRVVEDRQASALERQQALATIAGVLSLNPDMETQEATFADRLRQLMDARHVTQQELAARAGCSQPAISQMLNRNCRPQKRTIFKLAEALGVEPRDLWPDLETAEMLDAVASFQQDDYVMTQAEADALRDASRRNAPKIPVRSLPVRPH